MATSDTTKWTKADWDRFKEMNENFGPDIAIMIKAVDLGLQVDRDVSNYYKKHYGKVKK